MSNSRCSHGECAVEHASNENEAIAAPSRLVLPVFPYKGASGIAFACCARHDSTDKYCDEDAGQDEEQADFSDCGQSAVHEHNDEGRQPCHDQVDDEDLPALVEVAVVEETVHGYYLVGEDGRDGCGAEKPA